MVGTFLDGWAALGNAPALVCADGTILSYADLKHRVSARREALGARRRLILWEASPTPEAIITYLAALQGGHPVIAVAPGDHTRQNLIDRYRPDLLCGDSGVGTPAQPASPACHPDLALLLSTSGSTGTAKLVRLSRSNLDSNARSIAQFLGLTRDDRAALVLPLHYSYGLSVLHAHLAAGASIFLLGKTLVAPGALDEINAAACTNLSGVPYTFDLLEKIGFRSRMPQFLRLLTVAGGRMAPHLVTRYAAHMRDAGGQFFVMYGQTEATARIAFLPPDEALAHPDCIGDAIPGGMLSLMDEHGGQVSGLNRSGELVYRGPNVMMGYALTCADLARGAEHDCLHTGDLAERVADHRYRIVGRLSRFSKLAGLRIAHDEVERHLGEAGIAALVSGDDQSLIVAFIGATPPQQVTTLVATRLGLPATFVEAIPVRELPRLPSGKPDYAAVRALRSSQVAAKTDHPILAAFAATFAPQPVTPLDSFDSLGGDSLAYLQLSLALEAELGSAPPDWKSRSIASLEATKSTTTPATEPGLFRSWLRLAPIDTDLAVRAVAISLVVVHHATMWPLAGGAAALLLLVGYNLARFHGQRLFAGDGMAVLRASLRPVLIYYPMLLAYCLYRGIYPWQSLLLIGNWGIDGYSTMPYAITPFWFIEAYLQILLIAIGLFLIPPVRAFARAQPFAAGLAFLGACILLRETVNEVWHAGEMNIFFTPRILYVPALGWCIFFAAGRTQRLLMAGLAVALLLGLPYFEGNDVTILWVRAGILITAALLLIVCTRFLLPLLLVRVLMLVAAASFSIYLFHNLPYYLWLDDGSGDRDLALLHIVLGIALGIALHFVLLATGRWWRGTRIMHWLSGLWPAPARVPAGE